MDQIISLIPISWMAITFAYHFTQYGSRIDRYLSPRPGQYETYLMSAFLHHHPLHLLANLSTWYGVLSWELLSWSEILIAFCLGAFIGSWICVSKGEIGIGASGGLLGMLTMVALRYPLMEVYWSPIFLMKRLMILPLPFTILLNLGLDYLGNYLFQSPLDSVPMQYRWYFRNLNFFRYGLSNVSFYGHLGGVVGGFLAFVLKHRD